jgi:hypothetical protein
MLAKECLAEVFVEWWRRSMRPRDFAERSPHQSTLGWTGLAV